MVFVFLMAPGIAGLLKVQHLMLWATAALTMISGLHYVYIGMNILQQVEENG